MRAVLFAIVALLCTVPTFGQTAKMYKWMHPWFKKEVTSPMPPTWPYRVIKEKDSVIFVEVTPPTSTTLVTTPNTPTDTSSRESSPASPNANNRGDLNDKQQHDIVDVINSLTSQTPLYQEGSLSRGYSSRPYSDSSEYDDNVNGYSSSSYSGMERTVHVRSYTRRDGTHVRSHYRSTPRR